MNSASAQALADSATVPALCDSVALQAKLTGLLDGRVRDPVRVAVWQDDTIGFAATGPDSDHGAAEARIELGCLAKVLTAAVVLKCLAAKRIDVSTEFCALPDAIPAASVLRGVTVSHLLEHTHGLDDSILMEVPRTSGSLIDADVLVRKLISTPRLAPPGGLYSYSNAGAWLLGAYLERMYRAPYGEILAAKLLRPLGVAEETLQVLEDADDRVCPAMGKSLRLTVADLLRVVRDCTIARSSTPAIFTLQDAKITDYPGWSYAERGICLGLKHYGGGWFGHNSLRERARLLFRVHPEKRVALVVASRTPFPWSIAAHLFGSVFPELSDVHRPRYVRKPLQDSVLRELTAIYSRQATVVAIDGRDDHLELRAYTRQGAQPASRPFFVTALRPASDGFFYADSRSPVFQFAQFLSTASTPATHLWNGRIVWRRLPS